MPTTLIFGGSGKVARQITRILAQQTKPAHTVYSIIRSESHIPSLEEIGATPIVQSIEDSDVGALAKTIKQYTPSTVIWSAGAGGGSPARTEKVDKEGAIKVMDAVVTSGVVKRFILVSAVDVRDRENKKAPEWYDENDFKTSDRMWNALGPYMQAKLAADIDLRTENSRRGLEYTIVRPGSLSDDPGTGTVSAGKIHLGNKISREDVARVVIECMQNDQTSGLAFDVVGGNTPIKEAIDKVADERIDCFGGYH